MISNEGAINLNAWKEILNQYDVLRRKLKFRACVMFSGGEPLLSSSLLPLIKHAYELDQKTRFSILTNGVLLSQNVCKEFDSFKQNIRFQISLDGHDAASHDQVRGAGNFQKSRLGASILLEQGYSVHLLCVLSQRTAQKIPEFFQTTKNWGVSFLGFTRLIAEGSAKNLVHHGSDHTLGALELKRVYEEILYQSAILEIKTSTSDPLMHLLHPALGRSGRFWEGIIVNYQGQLLASSRSRIILGDILEEGLEKIFLTHPLLTSVRKGEIETCGSCKSLRRCGGDRNAAYAETGNYLSLDPGCWIAKI
ncbi:MAG: hypothetical protein HY072_06890 [Deltaproteobacteria bacterium]|nr:hypothetical protein [Deltaproteobacteria bacterium]